MATGAKEILILGGGFGGVYTARALEKILRPEEANITLVNRENYWVYQPMLSEVISGSIGVANVVSPIRRLCPCTNLVTREIEDIDLANKVVTVSPGFRPRQLKLPYDYLVIAVGNVTNFYGMAGMFENAFPFKTLADAMRLRNHVIRTLEEADVEEDQELRSKLLTFVVGGGGFSGVEVIAELNDFVRAVKGNYNRIRKEPHRCVLVHSRNRILQEMAEPLALFAQNTLRKRGVEISAGRPAGGGDVREGHYEIGQRDSVQDHRLHRALHAAAGDQKAGLSQGQGEQAADQHRARGAGL